LEVEVGRAGCKFPSDLAADIAAVSMTEEIMRSSRISSDSTVSFEAVIEDVRKRRARVTPAAGVSPHALLDSMISRSEARLLSASSLFAILELPFSVMVE